jgi:hypothetical protein
VSGVAGSGSETSGTHHNYALGNKPVNFTAFKYLRQNVEFKNCNFRLSKTVN